MKSAAAVPRPITLAAAQMGPIARTGSSAAVQQRMIALMRQAAAKGVLLIARTGASAP